MANWLDLPLDVRRIVIAKRNELEERECTMWREVIREYEEGFLCIWDRSTETFLLREKRTLPFPLHLRPCKAKPISEKDFREYMDTGDPM